MSAQPLTCPLTLDTLLAPNSLLCTTEGWPFQRGLWIHESLSSRAPSAGPLLRPSGVGGGWATRRGGPCRSQVCPAQLPGRLLRQHQQLLPQNTWHQRGRTRGSAEPWGRLERSSSLGKAGFQDLHGALRGLPSSMAQAKTHTLTPQLPPPHTRPSAPAMSTARLSSQEWALESLSGGRRGRQR